MPEWIVNLATMCMVGALVQTLICFAGFVSWEYKNAHHS